MKLIFAIIAAINCVGMIFLFKVMAEAPIPSQYTHDMDALIMPVFYLILLNVVTGFAALLSYLIDKSRKLAQEIKGKG